MGLAETLTSRSEKLKLRIRLKETMATRKTLSGDDLGRRMHSSWERKQIRVMSFDENETSG